MPAATSQSTGMSHYTTTTLSPSWPRVTSRRPTPALASSASFAARSSHRVMVVRLADFLFCFLQVTAQDSLFSVSYSWHSQLSPTFFKLICVCVWERERERESVCVCVCVCVWVRERENVCVRMNAHALVCAWGCVCVRVCVYVSACMHVVALVHVTHTKCWCVTERHDAIFVVGALDETIMLRGMRYHPIDVETSVLRSHKKICEWWAVFPPPPPPHPLHLCPSSHDHLFFLVQYSCRPK